MGLACRLLEFLGFGIGIPIGLLMGFFLFIYFEPGNVKDPIIRPLHDLDTSSLVDLLPEIPLWMKHPDFDRIEWLNKILFHMWPYLDKAICSTIRSPLTPTFAQYVGKFMLKSIEFETLCLGNLSPAIQGVKVHETNENEAVFEPMLRWAGNPNITLVLKLLALRIKLQLVDVQVFAAPRIVLKPLVPTFPCFASIVVSLMEKPYVDFGLKVLGGDIMAIPGLYQFVQETIRKQIANLYLWPQTYELPILEGSIRTLTRPVGLLHVKVVRALKLMKMDLLGSSDPYVKVCLSGERLPAKRTSIKMKNLNPVWNEEFKLTVKEPQSQVLELHVYDWEKVGTHDKLGMQVVPLRLLNPQETRVLKLNLVKNTNPNDPHNKKSRGQLEVELTFKPFKDDNGRFSGAHLLNGNSMIMRDNVGKSSKDMPLNEAGLLMLTVQGAQNVEGKNHSSNPYALVCFGGERKQTKLVRKTHNPWWNEEFQFVLEEAPVKDKIHIEVISKRRSFGFWRKTVLFVCFFARVRRPKRTQKRYSKCCTNTPSYIQTDL
ncbi:hypothetical protein FNV43_RR16945 [Rhamnella rubrinervis]|uniref:Synaptotagmin-3 n=1 Tax=Rhamnella rubrinervis TaxID=2594499 RepID=A0A8K0GZQ3_9ROSA|nr:hypothetical protein FNV43_RR16945 [Rhamnella rubrinervis]